MIIRVCSLSVILVSAFSASSMADMIYTPVNPSFGGSPYNSNHLQSLATTQNEFKGAQTERERQSTSERFLTMLQSRLYSSLASQVADAIFGENAQPSGTITFDDQQVSFTNTGTEIILVVTDYSTGDVTNISIPTLVP